MPRNVATAEQPRPPVNAYTLLSQRVMRAINAPAAQKDKAAMLERYPGDDPEAWDRVLEEIGENDNVTIAHRDDGHVQVFWTVPKED